MKVLKTLFWIISSLLLILIVGLSKYLYFPKSHQILENTYENWSAPIVKHILPSFDHEQLLVKISTKEPQKGLTLKVNSKTISYCDYNQVKDQYFCFYTSGLTPNTLYELELFDANNRSISDPWSIKTYPHPDSAVDEMTIMAYTCAGGIDGHFFGQEVFNDVLARQALLKRGLEFEPDVIIANGDHIYWDQKSFEITTLKKLLSLRRDRKFGKLNLQKAMLGTENIDVFTHMVDAQIAELYGAYLREHNVLFVSDDHDLLENDEALANLITLPPKDYMLDAGRSTQALYYPEFLSNRLKPDFLDRVNDYSNERLKLYSSFGNLQFGDLVEINLYDSKKYCTLDGNDAVMIPLEVEKWLTERTREL